MYIFSQIEKAKFFLFQLRKTFKCIRSSSKILTHYFSPHLKIPCRNDFLKLFKEVFDFYVCDFNKKLLVNFTLYLVIKQIRKIHNKFNFIYNLTISSFILIFNKNSQILLQLVELCQYTDSVNSILLLKILRIKDKGFYIYCNFIYEFKVTNVTTTNILIQYR